MTTTPNPTAEEIVYDALGQCGMLLGTREHAARDAVERLRAEGLLGGDPTEEQIDRALTAYENHAGCRGDEFREYVCPECGHLYATVEDRRAGLEGIDLYEAGHRHRMTEALAAAGVAPPLLPASAPEPHERDTSESHASDSKEQGDDRERVHAATISGVAPQDQRHFAPYGSTNAACGETVPRGALDHDPTRGVYADPRFTDKRSETTCSECQFRDGITSDELAPAPSPDREKLIEEAKYLSENSWQTWWPDRAQRALAACADALAAAGVAPQEPNSCNDDGCLHYDHSPAS